MNIIKYQEEISAYFGYWPMFSDGQILSFARRGDAIEMDINYIDIDKALEALIKIEFHGVSAVDLSEYIPNSVIDTMRILSGTFHRVSIESCYGFEGSFKCGEIRAYIVNE